MKFFIDVNYMLFVRSKLWLSNNTLCSVLTLSLMYGHFNPYYPVPYRLLSWSPLGSEGIFKLSVVVLGNVHGCPIVNNKSSAYLNQSALIFDFVFL